MQEIMSFPIPAFVVGVVDVLMEMRIPICNWLKWKQQAVMKDVKEVLGASSFSFMMAY